MKFKTITTPAVPEKKEMVQLCEQDDCENRIKHRCRICQQWFCGSHVKWFMSFQDFDDPNVALCPVCEVLGPEFERLRTEYYKAEEELCESFQKKEDGLTIKTVFP
jgi:hypothetical protein